MEGLHNLQKEVEDQLVAKLGINFPENTINLGEIVVSNFSSGKINFQQLTNAVEILKQAINIKEDVGSLLQEFRVVEACYLGYKTAIDKLSEN